MIINMIMVSCYIDLNCQISRADRNFIMFIVPDTYQNAIAMRESIYQKNERVDILKEWHNQYQSSIG